MCDYEETRKRAEAECYAKQVQAAVNPESIGMNHSRPEVIKASTATPSANAMILQFRKTELKNKVTDLKRFLRTHFPYENRDLAIFKLDEAEMWALKALETN